MILLYKNEVAYDAGCYDDQYGVNLGEIDHAKAAGAQQHRLDDVGLGRAKVFAVHEQQRCRGNEAHHHRTQAHKGPLDDGAVLVLGDEVAGIEHQHKGRQHHGYGGHQRPEHTVAAGHIANVGGTVDAYGAWRHLRDGHNVGKGLVGDLRAPARAHYLVLDEREHGIAATEAEQPDFQVSPHELEIGLGHCLPSFLSVGATQFT